MPRLRWREKDIIKGAPLTTVDVDVQDRSAPTLTLVLAEAELEPVPDSIREHPAVRARARSRGKRAGRTLLDSSYHHHAMRGLEGADRRGRPDIVHQALLLAQDTPLNRRGRLRLLVHTREDIVIHVDPEMRPPRNYERFVGLVEQLLREGEVGEGRALMRTEVVSLGALLERLGTWNLALVEDGERADPVEVLRAHLDRDVAAVVGAFPHGALRGGTQWADARLSLGAEQLTAPTVVARVVYAYERALEGAA